MNINECGCRPYEWLGLDGDRCIRVIPRQSSLNVVNFSILNEITVPLRSCCMQIEISRSMGSHQLLSGSRLSLPRTETEYESTYF